MTARSYTAAAVLAVTLAAVPSFAQRAKGSRVVVTTLEPVAIFPPIACSEAALTTALAAGGLVQLPAACTINLSAPVVVLVNDTDLRGAGMGPGGSTLSSQGTFEGPTVFVSNGFALQTLAPLVEGAPGRAYDFSAASSQWIDIQTPSIMQFGAQFRIEEWLQLTQTTGQGSIYAFGQQWSHGPQDYRGVTLGLQRVNGTLVSYFRGADGVMTSSTCAYANPTAVHHVSQSKTAGRMTLHIDGVPCSSVDVPANWMLPTPWFATLGGAFQFVGHANNFTQAGAYVYQWEVNQFARPEGGFTVPAPRTSPPGTDVLLLMQGEATSYDAVGLAKGTVGVLGLPGGGRLPAYLPAHKVVGLITEVSGATIENLRVTGRGTGIFTEHAISTTLRDIYISSMHVGVEMYDNSYLFMTRHLDTGTTPIAAVVSGASGWDFEDVSATGCQFGIVVQGGGVALRNGNFTGDCVAVYARAGGGSGSVSIVDTYISDEGQITQAPYPALIFDGHVAVALQGGAYNRIVGTYTTSQPFIYVKQDGAAERAMVSWGGTWNLPALGNDVLSRPVIDCGGAHPEKWTVDVYGANHFLAGAFPSPFFGNCAAGTFH